MSLSAGTKLGSYEVAAQIVAGGMDEVYQARDSKLDRAEKCDPNAAPPDLPTNGEEPLSRGLFDLFIDE